MIEVTRGGRPGKPQEIGQSLFQPTFDDLWTLIDQCWASKPEDRLPMDTVLSRLEKMLPTLTSSSLRQDSDLSADGIQHHISVAAPLLERARKYSSEKSLQSVLYIFLMLVSYV